MTTQQNIAARTVTEATAARFTALLKLTAVRVGKAFWGYTEAQEKADTSSYDGLL